MPVWLRYTLARVGLFVGVLVLLLVIGFDWIWAALVATVIAFCVSFIFLRGQREEFSGSIAARRPRKGRDEDAEDATDPSA